MTKILVTGGGTATAVSVVKGIRMAAVEDVAVVLGDPDPQIAGRFIADGFVRLPRADAPAFVEDLLEVCRREEIDVVVPVFDLEFPKLAAGASRFAEEGVRLVLSPEPAVSICRDKRLTMQFLGEIGVPHPETYPVEQARELGAEAYPLFVKPRDGRGSIDAFRVGRPADLERILARVDMPLVQRCVEGEEVEELTIDTMSDFEGKFLGACPRIREVVKAGQSYKGKTVDDAELVDMARRICEALPIHGPACIQCFRTPRGPFFFEINPRFGAASVLSMTAGLNGPAMIVELARGGRPEAPAVRAGVRMLRYWDEVFVDVDASGALVGRHA